MNISTGGDRRIEGDRGAGVVVLIDLRRDAQRVRRFIENDLGWQTVDVATAVHVPPQVVVTDRLDDTDPSGGFAAGLPRVMLVHEREARPAPHRPAVRLSQGADPAGCVTLTWPRERARFEDLVVAALGRVGAPSVGGPVVRVAASRPSVGATTVTLALAGLAGWSGHHVAVYVHGRVPVRGLVDPSPLDRRQPAGSPRPVHRGSRLPGAGNVTVVPVGVAPRPPLPTDPAVGVVYCETGPLESTPESHDEADILVASADEPGLRAARRSRASIVVMVGADTRQPQRTPAAQRLAGAGGPRLLVGLPWDARVARCARLGAVPCGLPGRWLRPLMLAQRTLLTGRRQSCIERCPQRH